MDKIAALSAILEANPVDAFARYGLAMAFAADGNADRALAEYSRIIEDTPDYVPAYQMSAQLLLKLGRTEDAQERLRDGVKTASRIGNTHAVSEMQALLDEVTS
jgi:tetratricopeptide (TPR) repeat protein